MIRRSAHRWDAEILRLKSPGKGPEKEPGVSGRRHRRRETGKTQGNLK